MTDSNDDKPGYFNEIPKHYEKHPANYLRYFADILKHHRRKLQPGEQGARAFANKLSEYTGTKVNRSRLIRLEKGDPTVSWGVVAAYLFELGLYKQVLKSIVHGNRRDIRYLTLLNDELSPQIIKAMEKADETTLSGEDKDNAE